MEKASKDCNFSKPTLKLFHCELRRSDSSKYRSVCPTCKEGILPCRRDKVRAEIEAWDMCLLCGQFVTYEDFESIDDNAARAAKR